MNKLSTQNDTGIYNRGLISNSIVITVIIVTINIFGKSQPVSHMHI